VLVLTVVSGVYHRILVAVDGSPDAHRALAQAVELARDQNARLTLLTVISPLAGFASLAPSSADQVALARRCYEQILREATDAVPPDISVTTLLLEGPPAKRIVERVREGGHDLVVMGSHGRGRLGSALLGSVSQQVVHHSPVPVLACHALRDEARAA
jgi:nucleotide-binding universal stress UspA family protein